MESVDLRHGVVTLVVKGKPTKIVVAPLLALGADLLAKPGDRVCFHNIVVGSGLVAFTTARTTVQVLAPASSSSSSALVDETSTTRSYWHEGFHRFICSLGTGALWAFEKLSAMSDALFYKYGDLAELHKTPELARECLTNLCRWETIRIEFEPFDPEAVALRDFDYSGNRADPVMKETLHEIAVRNVHSMVLPLKGISELLSKGCGPCPGRKPAFGELTLEDEEERKREEDAVAGIYFGYLDGDETGKPVLKVRFDWTCSGVFRDRFCSFAL